jgi:CRP/FNR family transcriptional regulator, cyclic AMP receptor protein
MQRGEVHERMADRGWFADLDHVLANAVLDCGRLVSVNRGEPLFRPENDPGGIYGVVAGGMLMFTTGHDGSLRAEHIMRRGAWFGYGAVLFRHNRTRLAEANEPSLLLHVPLAQLDGLRQSIPSADLALRLLAAHGEMALQNAISDLLIPNADHRLAAVLLRVTGCVRLPPGPRRPEGLQHELRSDPWGNAAGEPLTQTLLADLANVSRQTVARFVDRASQEGWIEWRYGRVRILKPGDIKDFIAENA